MTWLLATTKPLSSTLTNISRNATAVDQELRKLRAQKQQLQIYPAQNVYLPNPEDQAALKKQLLDVLDGDDLIEDLISTVELDDVEERVLYQHFAHAYACEQQGDRTKAATSYEYLSQAYAKQQNFPLAWSCLEKTSELQGERHIRFDALRQCFHQHLDAINGNAVSMLPYTCFICFNFEEDDVKNWLENHFVPGFAPCRSQCLVQPKRPSTREAFKPIFKKKSWKPDRVALICTPETKAKALDRENKKQMKGIAGELQMLRDSFEKPFLRQNDTCFPIYLKGNKDHSFC